LFGYNEAELRWPNKYMLRKIRTGLNKAKKTGSNLLKASSSVERAHSTGGGMLIT
jgi:hypothetical protein